VKILFLKHRYAAFAAGLLAAAAIFAAAEGPAAVAASAAARQLPVYCVQRDQKVCSITFDAAWGDASTKELVDILGRYDVKATFFVIGKWAEQYPDDVKMLADNGMEVMSHSYAHDHMTQLSSDAIKADINKCSDAIEKLTGTRPTLFRCPYGDYDDHVINAVRSLGMEPIQWDVDSLDWKGIKAPEIEKRVESKVKNGSIILFHNAGENTPQALPSVIEYLLSQGYEIVPVSKLLLGGGYGTDWTIDASGMQCAAK
jgi:polysaccharide deacetylase family sporulation protein PdaB